MDIMEKVEDFYTTEQVAEKLAVDKNYIAELIRDGRLVGYKRGKRQYFLHSDLIAFIIGGEKSEANKEKTKKFNPVSKANLIPKQKKPKVKE